MITLEQKAQEIWRYLGHVKDSPEFPLQFIATALQNAERFVVTMLSRNVEAALPISVMRIRVLDEANGSENEEAQITMSEDTVKIATVKFLNWNDKIVVGTYYPLEIFYQNQTFAIGERASGYYWTTWGRERLIIIPASWRRAWVYYIACPPPLDPSNAQNQRLTLPPEFSQILTEFVVAQCKAKIKDYAGAKLAMDICMQMLNAYMQALATEPGRN